MPFEGSHGIKAIPKYPKKMTTQRLVTLLLLSPLAALEFRIRMRGWRVPLLLGLAAGVPMAVYLLRLHSLWPGHLSPAEYLRLSAATGHRIFYEMMTAEALLCLLLMPALSAATFAQDCEKNRLEELLRTPLRDEELLLGKLGPILSFMLIILCCALPAATMSFILGGVSPSDVYDCLLFIIPAVIFQALLGLSFSLVAKNVTIATALAYLAFAGCLLAMVIPGLTLFAAVLATFPTFFIIGIIVLMRIDFYRYVWPVYAIATILLFITLSVYFSRGHPIPVFRGFFGEYWFQWSIIYLYVHLLGIMLIYPYALQLLKRLRPGYWQGRGKL